MENKPTIPVLRIANWNANFENAKSRKVNHKSYGQYVLKQGRGYCRLMLEKDGPAIYGTFIALASIVQSKPSETREGYLTSTGDKSGYPYSFEDMAAVTRIPIKMIKRAITVLVGNSVHWLIGDTMRIPQGYHEDTTVSEQYACIVLYCTESTESSKRPKRPAVKDPFPDDFKLFWKAYPKKQAKQDALKAWKQTEKIRPAVQTIVDKLNLLKATWNWKKEKGQYVPKPATWLRSGCWDDEVEVEIKQAHVNKTSKVQVRNEDGSITFRTFQSQAEADKTMTSEGYAFTGSEWRK